MDTIARNAIHNLLPYWNFPCHQDLSCCFSPVPKGVNTCTRLVWFLPDVFGLTASMQHITYSLPSMYDVLNKCGHYCCISVLQNNIYKSLLYGSQGCWSRIFPVFFTFCWQVDCLFLWISTCLEEYSLLSVPYNALSAAYWYYLTLLGYKVNLGPGYLKDHNSLYKPAWALRSSAEIFSWSSPTRHAWWGCRIRPSQWLLPDWFPLRYPSGSRWKLFSHFQFRSEPPLDWRQAATFWEVVLQFCSCLPVKVQPVATSSLWSFRFLPFKKDFILYF